MKSVALSGFRYIENGDGRPELYDFEHDVMEKNDLLKPTGDHAMLASLRKILRDVTATGSGTP
jgi:hypothetical protein